ncbi:hypothetical protein U3516DRAFT_744964 [Neocallimastix sp. 'constans']
MNNHEPTLTATLTATLTEIDSQALTTPNRNPNCNGFIEKQLGEMQLGEMQHFNTTPLGEMQPGEMQFGEITMNHPFDYIEKKKKSLTTTRTIKLFLTATLTEIDSPIKEMRKKLKKKSPQPPQEP